MDPNFALHALGLILNRNLHGARATLSMRILRQMASYREVATEDARKCPCRMLEAETKPLITDLLSLVPRPFEGRRKGQVHTVCACAKFTESFLAGYQQLPRGRAGTDNVY